MAQSVEQLIRNQQVAGSNPVTSSKSNKQGKSLAFIILKSKRDKKPRWDGILTQSKKRGWL